jgi:hypothetical protein
MPRREKRCPDCLDKGYLSVLPWRHGDERKIVACGECRHGRRFLRVWRRELAKTSPPTKRKPSPVHSKTPADEDIREEVETGKRQDGTLRFHEGD